MLTTLKGKLLTNVSKLTLLNTSTEEEPIENPNIPLNSGADILTHFQKEWVELHEINEENAKNANSLAQTINNLHKKVSKDYSNVIEINQLLNTPPLLNKTIDVCFKQIKDLQKSFENTEKGLLDLEDAIERLELEKGKIEHKYQLALYKEKKLANLEKVREELATKQAHKLMEEEVRQRKILEERRQVFHDAFNSDLETYKSLGSIPKIKTNVQPSALLEEIQLDLDRNDLESFLNGQWKTIELLL